MAFRLQTESISTQVYLSLKKSILEGELPPGERLLVLDIANKYQISQAPVREALERLKQEELIVSQPNRGSFVSDITAKEIVDIHVMREMIEGYAVRQSIPTLTENDFKNLEKIIKGMEEAHERKDLLRILELDLEFHGFFYIRCDNHVVLDTWDRMKMKVMRFMAISNKYHSTEKLAEVHYRLLDVLKSGDLDAAEQEFIYHMKAYRFIPLP